MDIANCEIWDTFILTLKNTYMKHETTHEVVMLLERYETLRKCYDTRLIKEIGRNKEGLDIYVAFNITIRSGFDLLEIFHSGVQYGINIDKHIKSISHVELN